MQFGKLTFTPINGQSDLVSEPTFISTTKNHLSEVLVSEINPELSDTSAFCDFYDIGMDTSANCVIVEARRADRTWYAACFVLANSRADINGIVRRYLDARKISFAPMEQAVSLTNMEFGGITPIGLPEEWPILIDNAVANKPQVIIGSGIRKSKLLVPGNVFAELPNSVVMDIVKADP